MAKVIKITPSYIYLKTDIGELIKVKNDDFYDFNVDDYVEVFHDGDEFVLTLAEEQPQRNSKSKWKEFDDRPQGNGYTEQNININYSTRGRVVSQLIYVLIAILLGGIGGQKFYSGKIGLGLLMLFLCWTPIPAIVAIFDIIHALSQKADDNGNIVV